MATANRKVDDSMDEFMLRMGRAAYCDCDRAKNKKNNQNKNVIKTTKGNGRKRVPGN